MPLVKIWDNGPFGKAAIWEVTESERFFEEALGRKAGHKLLKRRLEYLASRFLLSYLEPSFPLDDIVLSDSGKPRLQSADWGFSISHSFPYIAVAIDYKGPVGVDIQTYEDKILRLAPKFLSPGEMALFGEKKETFTLAWSGKEAAFKYFGLTAIDFKEHMPIVSFDLQEQDARMRLDFRKAPARTMLEIAGGLADGFAWSLTKKADQ